MAQDHHHHHNHHHAGHAQPPATESPSILRQSLGGRLAVVSIFIAALWAAVYWTIA